MKWFITGDTHGKVYNRIITSDFGMTHNAALIILGDAGLNFYLNKTDKKEKQRVEHRLAAFDSYLYIVRGNHEERPQNLGMNWFKDTNVLGKVYMETEFPHIRYLMDGGTYIIDGKSTLVIGGAYSVDKYWRLKGKPEDTAEWTGWFKDEQLTETEMIEIARNIYNASYDMVLTHTCPLSWEPRDLFLSVVNQDKVDKTMENFLEEVKNRIDYGLWLFGHYHQNRLMRPHVEMLYQAVYTLDEISARWRKFDENHGRFDLEDALLNIKDLNFYMED